MLITSQRREGKSINRSLTLFSAKIFRNHLAFFTGRFPLVFFINIATRGYDSPSLVFISPPPQSPSHKLYILETKFRSVFEFFCFLLSWNYYKLMFHFLNEKYKIKFMKILTRHVGSFFHVTSFVLFLSNLSLNRRHINTKEVWGCLHGLPSVVSLTKVSYQKFV